MGKFNVRARGILRFLGITTLTGLLWTIIVVAVLAAVAFLVFVVLRSLIEGLS